MTTLQGQIQGAMSQIAQLEQRINQLQNEVAPSWPVITKYAFRQLLTNEQMLMWDNWQDMELGLTQQEKWQMNSFFKSFDTAEKVTMTSPMMLAGMEFFVAKGLLTQEEADRILAGQPVPVPEPEPEPEV